MWYIILTNWKIEAIWLPQEKVFEKIQHAFMIKTLQKAGIKGTYLKIIKDIYDKPTADIILNSEKLKVFLLKSGTRQGCPLSPLLLNIGLEVLTTAIREEKEIKGIQIGKEEVKFSVCKWHDPLYRKPKDTTRKLLELSNKCGRVAGYKVNTHKSLLVLYNNNERREREIKETIPFNTATERIKYLGIQFSSIQSLSHVRLFATPWIAAHQASLSITNSQSSPKPMSIE